MVVVIAKDIASKNVGEHAWFKPRHGTVIQESLLPCKKTIGFTSADALLQSMAWSELIRAQMRKRVVKTIDSNCACSEVSRRDFLKNIINCTLH